ncbi:hypothetical protein E2C01_026195 [Portunus trituberculatus]|uniref:Uncharacterized protein n=1 Tax=Portunus trituberculatus TaxID=210409 RepID=A0A5B7EIH7_PORTR|nr:hypothetical protein [Portunus trituberculatus]
MKRALSPLKDPLRPANVWYLAHSVPHTTPQTSLILPVSGAWCQRALVHGELFSPVPSQTREPYTPSTRLYERSPYHPFRTPPLQAPSGAASGRLLVKLETAKEKKDLLSVPCLGPQAGPDGHFLPPCGAQGRHDPQRILAGDS